MMKRLTTIIILSASLFMIGCSDPKATVIPESPDSWKEALKEPISKLSEEDQKSLANYMKRKVFSSVMGGDAIGSNVTIGDAIADQQKYEQLKAEKEAEELALKQELERKKKAFQEKMGSMLLVTLIEKKVLPVSYSENRYSPRIHFEFGIKNKSDETIRAFMGTASFNDIFDDTIKLIEVKYDTPLEAGEQTSYEAGYDANRFNEHDNKLAETTIENIKFQFEVTKVILASGETLEVE